MNENEKIDLIVMWVDGSDETWRKEREKYDQSEQKESSDKAENRYRDWGLMPYWFRGIESNAPWIHRIHFVTWGHVPVWLDTKNPKINIVNHKAFIPETYLPTFNANTIELNLHRIQGLAEKFVLFNDDMFLIDPVKPEDFFKKELPCETLLFDVITGSGKGDIFDHILLNNNDLLNRNFTKREFLRKNSRKLFSLKNGVHNIRNILLLPWKRITGFKDLHLPSAFLKQSFIDVWNREEKCMDACCRHKFRNVLDYNQYLIKQWQFAQGNFMPRSRAIGKKYELSDDNQDLILALKNKKYRMICINDSGIYSDSDRIRNELIQCFQSIFPKKSSFEI